jgi:predicted RNase H-like nuclease (RuvC/YqgF family)
MELQRHALEKKELQEKVTKLELELQHQKERFDDMKYDLRDVKREKEGGGKPIIVSTCVLLLFCELDYVQVNVVKIVRYLLKVIKC